MKHLKKYLFLFAIAATLFSCKKDVIEYNTTPVTDQAEFQLHYMVPLNTGTVNNIYKVEINGELYANNTSPLSTYNAIPSGSVGKFFVTKPGVNNIKLYKGTNLELVYDQSVTLVKGKQNVFVHSFTQPPTVIDAGYPFTPLVTDSTAKVAWVRFYNFLYETDGVPTPLKLQYQRQYVVAYATPTTPEVKSDWINVGSPVSFGEATGWEQIDVNKPIVISAGTARVDYRIRMIGANGADLGSLMVMNSSNAFVEYSDYWNASIGRRYMHILSGFRAAKPTSAVRQFTSL